MKKKSDVVELPKPKIAAASNKFSIGKPQASSCFSSPKTIMTWLRLCRWSWAFAATSRNSFYRSPLRWDLCPLGGHGIRNLSRGPPTHPKKIGKKLRRWHFSEGFWKFASWRQWPWLLGFWVCVNSLWFLGHGAIEGDDLRSMLVSSLWVMDGHPRCQFEMVQFHKK